MRIEDTGRMTATQVASVFGVTKQAVGLWHSRTHCPRNPDGTYDLSTVIRWRLERVREEFAAEGCEVGDSPHDERWRKARADLLEMQRDQRREQLVERDEVRRREARIAAVFKQSLLNAPRELAPLVAGMDAADAEAAIRAKHEQILRNLAK